MIPNELILFAGHCASAALGFFLAALLASRRMHRAYRDGRTDMEKLIRDRQVADLRDRTSARL